MDFPGPPGATRSDRPGAPVRSRRGTRSDRVAGPGLGLGELAALPGPDGVRVGQVAVGADGVGVGTGQLADLVDLVPLADHPILVAARSEAHTSELQSRGHLVCRLLLE